MKCGQAWLNFGFADTSAKSFRFWTAVHLQTEQDGFDWLNGGPGASHFGTGSPSVSGKDPGGMEFMATASVQSVNPGK